MIPKSTRILGLAMAMALAPATQAVEERTLDHFQGLEFGMTEAELLEAYPDGTLSFDGINFTIEAQLGDFMRDDERFEDGLIIAKLRPQVADERGACLAFHDAVLPTLVERFGEPDSANRVEESDWAVFESSWSMSGNGIIGIMARFVDGHGKCDAQIAVSGSNMKML